MSKWHVNPDTGDIGRCSAKIKCAFEDIGAEHFESQEDALRAAERILEEKVGVFKVSKKNKVEHSGPVSELAFTLTELDYEEMYRRYAAHENVVSQEDALAYLSNPKDKEARERIEKAVKEKIDRKLFGDYEERITYENLFAKAYREGVKVSPELEDAFDRNWNDPEFYGGEKYTVERFNEANRDIIEAKKSNSDIQTMVYLYEKRNRLKSQLKSKGRNNPVFVAQTVGEVEEKIIERLSTPTEDDKKEAREYVLMMYGNGNGKINNWDRLMPNKNMTRKNQERFRDLLEQEALDDSSIDYEDAVKRQAEVISNRKFFARRYKEGFLTPAVSPMERLFEDHWKEEKPKVEEKLKYFLKLEKDFKEGKFTARQIIGRGYRNPKLVAEDYISKNIEENKAMLESNGRSDHSFLLRLQKEGTIPQEYKLRPISLKSENQ